MTVGTVSALRPQYATIGGTYSISTLASTSAVVLVAKSLSELDDVVATGQVSADKGSIVGARIIGFGRGLGTLVGTIGTIAPSANNIIAELYQVGTTATGGALVPEGVPDGTAVIGSIAVTETGR